MSAIRLETLDPADNDEVARLILAGLADHWGSIDPTLNPDLDDLGATYGHGRTLVARDADGSIVGTGTIVPRDDTTAEVLRMSVDSNRRRGGVGRLVLDGLIAVAGEWGMHRVILETTSTWEATVAFYLAQGFRVTHTELGAFGEDTWFERVL